jgi:hypothetical protein
MAPLEGVSHHETHEELVKIAIPNFALFALLVMNETFFYI